MTPEEAANILIIRVGAHAPKLAVPMMRDAFETSALGRLTRTVADHDHGAEFRKGLVNAVDKYRHGKPGKSVEARDRNLQMVRSAIDTLAGQDPQRFAPLREVVLVDA